VNSIAAKRFFQKVFRSSANPIPRVINVDKNAAYPPAIAALKKRGTLPRRVRLRQCKFLNNVIEMVQSQMTNSVLSAGRN
jgi:transposase, IS6 family